MTPAQAVNWGWPGGSRWANGAVMAEPSGLLGLRAGRGRVGVEVAGRVGPGGGEQDG